jgi:predicted RecA/RadA family phage recombinase
MTAPALTAPRRIRAGAAVVLGSIFIAVLLAGCTQSVAVDTSASPDVDPSPSATTQGDASASSPCELIDDAMIESLLGDVPEGTEVTVPGSDLPACEFGDLTANGIQVSRVPASEWAAALPGIVQQMQSLPAGAVNETALKQLASAAEQIAAGATVAEDTACEYFSSLLEIRGEAPGTSLAVSYYPDLASAIAVTGQTCVDGAFTSLVLGRSDLAGDASIADQVATVLTQLG